MLGKKLVTKYDKKSFTGLYIADYFRKHKNDAAGNQEEQMTYYITSSKSQNKAEN